MTLQHWMKNTNEDDLSLPLPQRSQQQQQRRRRHVLQQACHFVVLLGGGGGMLRHPPLAAAAAAATITPTMPSSLGYSSSSSSSSSSTGRLGGLPAKIRGVCRVMDELQRDLMQERWDLVEVYPEQLRSYVPVFTTYTDSAFSSDAPTDKALRVALRYEVGRFFASLERLRQAAAREALDESYVAYSDMALHLDRYLRVGGLYTYYDNVISLEPYYDGIPRQSLVYANPEKDPPLVRDLVVLTAGPDMGRTGIVLGIYPDGTNTCAVKLDAYKGMREIRIVPRAWAAKRLGEQDPDQVFLLPRTIGTATKLPSSTSTTSSTTTSSNNNKNRKKNNSNNNVKAKS